jgi:hypothetical protein
MSGSRRTPGRLGPFVNGYHAWLLGLGYAPASVTHSLGALGHLGRWMDSRNIDAEQLNGDVLTAFLADHVDRYGHLPSAGVMPVLDYLRSVGVAAPKPTGQASALDAFLDEYRHWLSVERELSLDTVRGYTRVAGRFLAERVSAEDERGVDGLAGADGTWFLLRESTRVRPGSVCCHANQLRQLLRYLSMRGFLIQVWPMPVRRLTAGATRASPSSRHARRSSGCLSRVIGHVGWVFATSRS